MKTLSKLWSILSPAQKRSAVGLIVLMFAGMLLEILGVGIVVPALTVMSGDKLEHPTPAIQKWLDWLGNPTKTQLLLGGLALFFGLYAFKAAFLLFSSWRQLRFVSRFQADLGKRLFAIYLEQPWSFHLQRNSAALLQNIESTTLLANTFAAVLGLAAEMLLLLGMLALLLWFEPVGALAVGCLMAAATWFLERLTRKRLTHWGQKYHHHAKVSKKNALQGLNGAKEIKLLGREKPFIKQFAMHREAMVGTQTKNSFLHGVPRLFYELLAIGGLCLLTAVMVWQGKTTQAMVPTLGLFAAAAFRMLPSVNRLAISIQSLRFSAAMIDTVAAELLLEPPRAQSEASTRFTFSRDVSLEKIIFRYPGGHENAVDGVGISIPHGSSIGLIGGSGAGKSTLVDIVLGLLSPTSGRVTVDGIDVATNLRGWQNLIGYVPQMIYLSDDTLRRNVAFGIPDEKIDDAAVARALRAAQLEEFVAGLPEGLQTMVGERGVRLSGGQRQRIGIARALYHDPEILVLDEATSALDNDTEQEVMKAVDALHGAKTLLIVAHRLSTVAKCDRLYRLENGRVVQSGTFAEVVLQDSTQSEPKVAAPAT